MPNPVTPMEPMDTKLCVLLQLQLINSTTTYTQTEICGIISNNQSSFDAIYNNPVSRQAARNEFLDEAKRIIVVDKQEDCG